MNRYDFEQNGGIEFWTGNLKKKNCNKARKISDFIIETEKRRNGNLKRKIGTNREIFFDFSIILELSNKTENQIRKIRTNREIFVSFIIISELSNKAEMLKKKIKDKKTNFRF